MKLCLIRPCSIGEVVATLVATFAIGHITDTLTAPTKSAIAGAALTVTSAFVSSGYHRISE